MTIQTTKEVETVTNALGSQRTAIQLYQFLTEHFERMNGHPETSVFRQRLFDLHKEERAYFRSIIDEKCEEYYLDMLSWRNVKYKPERVKRCEVCYNYFYDVSRNGRSKTCFNGGHCEREYEVRRGRGGTIQEPEYSRSVNIEFIDMQPDANDKEGQAKLLEMEKARQRENGVYYIY